MSLNIKDERVHAMVRELAELTGESQTRAVASAVSRSLAELRSERSTRAERILAIGKECAGRLDAHTRQLDHGDLLYDDAGLPRRSSTRQRSSTQK